MLFISKAAAESLWFGRPVAKGEIVDLPDAPGYSDIMLWCPAWDLGTFLCEPHVKPLHAIDWQQFYEKRGLVKEGYYRIDFSEHNLRNWHQASLPFTITAILLYCLATGKHPPLLMNPDDWGYLSAYQADQKIGMAEGKLRLWPYSRMRPERGSCYYE